MKINDGVSHGSFSLIKGEMFDSSLSKCGEPTYYQLRGAGKELLMFIWLIPKGLLTLSSFVENTW